MGPCLDICSAFGVLSQIRKHDAMRVLKTWVNSWATTHRCQEAMRFPCLFGCSDAKDSLTHYVMCPILFALNRQLCPTTPACPLRRLGLKLPTVDSALLVACMSAGYHAVKRASYTLSITNDILSFEERVKSHKMYAVFFLG